MLSTQTTPKVWSKEDIPTPEEMTVWLNRVRAVRSAFPSRPSLPELPESMSMLTYEKANDIERVLLAVDQAITRMEDSFFSSGEIDAGGF